MDVKGNAFCFIYSLSLSSKFCLLKICLSLLFILVNFSNVVNIWSFQESYYTLPKYQFLMFSCLSKEYSVFFHHLKLEFLHSHHLDTIFGLSICCQLMFHSIMLPFTANSDFMNYNLSTEYKISFC